MFNPGGTQLVTDQTDVAIGRSGRPIRVYFATALSDGTATVVKFYNGTSTGGTLVHQLDGTISKSASIYFGTNGLLFPAGCFVDVDSHTVTLAVAYETLVA